MEEWNTENEWSDEVAEESVVKETKEEKKTSKRRSSACVTRSEKTIYRRAFSETQLLDILPKEIKDKESYHCITAGDVDGLSYLKYILRHQDLDYCLFSTWCMASDDVLQFEEWLEQGKIKKLDAYVGEIFPSSYKYEYEKLKEIFNKYKCGRIAVFRNHAKIFAGHGKDFYFGIQTSANINTNPRTENGCITIDKKIFTFYKEYFDKIKTIVKDE